MAEFEPSVLERHKPSDNWIGSLSEAIEAGLQNLCSSRLHAFLALMLFAFVCFLPGFASLPPVDRDEPRFAQAAKQMMESGDYIDIRFQKSTRHKKPVGIYWMQVASAKVLGMSEKAPIWVYRLPSLLGALIGVGLTFLIGMRMISVRVGLLAGLAMAAGILLGVEARLAKTDAMLLATILAVQWLIWELYEHRRGLSLPKSLLFWGALGLGVLIKGPLIVMIVGLTVAALVIQERSFSWLSGMHLKFGLPLFLGIILPWFIAIGIQTEGAFYAESIGKDLLGKVASGKESHGAPPGVYLGATIGTFWPVSVFVILSIGWMWKERKQKLLRFALSWIIPAWIIFEFVPTKLPHYILPLLPPLAILSALAMERGAIRWENRWAKIVAILIPVGGLVLGLGGPVGLIVLENRVLPAALVLGLVAFGLGVLSYSVFLKGRVIAAFVLALAMAPTIYLNVHGMVFPSFRSVWLSTALVDAAQQMKPCETVKIASAGYSEPSLVFLGGTDIKFVGGQGAAKFVLEAECHIVIVEKHQEILFLNALGDKRELIEESARVDGYKLNGGKWQSFGLYRLKTG